MKNKGLFAGLHRREPREHARTLRSRQKTLIKQALTDPTRTRERGEAQGEAARTFFKKDTRFQNPSSSYRGGEGSLHAPPGVGNRTNNTPAPRSIVRVMPQTIENKGFLDANAQKQPFAPFASPASPHSLPQGGGATPIPSRFLNIKQKPAQATAHQLQWFINHGVTMFDIGVFTQDRSTAPVLRLDQSQEQVQHMRGWLVHKNTTRCDIYIRPAKSAEHGIIFLDDLPADTCRQVSHDYLDVQIIETSRANYQAWIPNQPTDLHDRTMLQVKLSKKYNSDPKSVDPHHFGRLAGFQNRKKNRSNDWINISTTNSRTPHNHQSTKPQPTDAERIIAALEHLDPDAIQYDEWIQICAALQSIEGGQSIWNNWNEQSDGSSAKTKATWKSFHGTSRISIATAFFICKKYGEQDNETRI